MLRGGQARRQYAIRDGYKQTPSGPKGFFPTRRLASPWR